jgi:hypothetical protein
LEGGPSLAMAFPGKTNTSATIRRVMITVGFFMAILLGY